MASRPTTCRPSATTSVCRDSSDPVKLVVLRGKDQQTLSVTPVEQRSDFDSVSAMADPTKNLVAGARHPRRRDRRRASPRPPPACAIRTASSSSHARRERPAEVPLLPRDVIRSVNNQYVTTLDRLREAVRGLKPGTPVTLQVQRDSRLMYISFTME